MLKLLVLQIASFVNQGYIEVWVDGEKISQHNQDYKAQQSCINHAANYIGPMTCILKFPDRHVVINLPNIGVEKPILPDDHVRTLVPEDGSIVFVCQEGRINGSIEPAGNDANDGLSMEGALRSLQKAQDLAAQLGADVLSCEGGLYIPPAWGFNGKHGDHLFTYYVNIDGKPYFGEPEYFGCGAAKEPPCPDPE